MRPLAPLLLALAACASPGAPRPLFNGTDLSGWVQVNCAPSTFTARDGLIVCSGKPTGVLRTDRMYENFVLELEYRHMTPGGNAGLFVWSDPLPARGVPFTRSLEVQVMDGVETPDYTSHGDIFSIWGASFTPDRPHPAGWERCLPSDRRARPAPEWNRYRVTCDDGTIRLEVNGAEVSGGTRASPRKGYICLESEGSEVHFRNLVIRELPPARPALEPRLVACEAGPLHPIYTGLDLSGWESASGGAADAAHWQARDWTLATDGEGGALRHAAVLGDFELQVDWRRLASARTRPPLDLGVELPEAMLAAMPGWHRTRAVRRDGRLLVELDGQPVLDGPAPAGAGPARLELRPDGQATEYANLFLHAR
jgi:hypothetical protein